MFDSRTRELAESVAAGTQVLVILTAPPGYGKTAFCRALAAHVGPSRFCILPSGAADVARHVLDALVADDAARAARFAVDRLAQRGDASANNREALRREWPAGSRDEVFVVGDPQGALATAAGVDVLGELVDTLPPGRRLVVSTRAALPRAVDAATRGAASTAVAGHQLALSEDDVRMLVRGARLSDGVAAAIFDAVRGWPLVSRLLVDHVRAYRDDEIVDATRMLHDDDVLAFAAHRSIALLPVRVREALAVASFFPTARYLDLVRILGPSCDDAVFARMASLPFVERDGDRAAVHAEISRVLRDRFPDDVEPLYEQTLRVLQRSGAHSHAARIALERGDGLRAAQIIEAAPPFTTVPVRIVEYERVIERIDDDAIARFPNAWIATIPYRSFSIDPATYIREAETIYFCLPPGTDPDQRAAVLMLLASAYVNVGRAQDAEAVLVEALSGFAADEGQARASLLNFAASLRGIDGRFREARALAEEAARIGRDTFGESQTLHYIEAHEAAFRGRQERIVVILDELIHRRTGTDPPLYLAYIAMNGVLFSWVNGDDASYERYLSVFEDATTPAIETALAVWIDATRGRAAPGNGAHPWALIEAVSHLYRMGDAATEAEALVHARAAVAAADVRGAPYTRSLAHLALALLDEPSRAREIALLEALVKDIEAPEFREAVLGAANGGPAGMLESFIERRVRRTRKSSEPRVTIELLRGRVTCDGNEIRLREKEFELLALLASTRGSLSRDQIGEALWEHLDTTEWSNNLKVTVYRVRRALGTRNVTVLEDARHRLAPAVEVDVRQAEAIVRDRSRAPLDETSRGEIAAILDAFHDGILERYERFSWSHTLVARLNDLACSCGLTLAADALEHGRFDDAFAYATRVRDLDDLNEKACEIAIRALRGAGAADRARREFQRYAGALERELATVPSSALADLIRGC